MKASVNLVPKLTPQQNLRLHIQWLRLTRRMYCQKHVNKSVPLVGSRTCNFRFDALSSSFSTGSTKKEPDSVHAMKENNTNEPTETAIEKLASVLLGGSNTNNAEHVTWLSVWSNFGLAGGKAGAGWATGSVSLIADAAHSMSDLASDAVTLFSLHLGQRRADRTHPYGYGRYETLGTCAVAGLSLNYESLMHTCTRNWHVHTRLKDLKKKS